MSRYDSHWMWADACALLDRAERLQRQFFDPGPRSAGAGWEPPMDLFETERALWVVVALPGVAAEQIELSIQGSALVVAGVRKLPPEMRAAAIRRMEIPSGRFERQVQLPPGEYELALRSFVDGCLTLGLRKRPVPGSAWSTL